MTEGLRFLVRTPHEVVLDERVEAARVPTETGQVGLRPRQEPVLFAVEPGLVLFRVRGVVRFAATAGGLFEGGRDFAVVYTPFAVVGEDVDDVTAALEKALAIPDSELAARHRLGELEERIVEEIRHRPNIAPARHGHA